MARAAGAGTFALRELREKGRAHLIAQMQASPETQVILVHDFVGRGMSRRIRSLPPSAA
jgi:hypothetical protein